MQDLGAALMMAAILAFIWGMRSLQVRKRQQEREMLHRERMTAMEKGIPLPEFPAPANGGDDSLMGFALEGKQVLPKLTLGCALVLLFGGFGFLTASMIAKVEEISQFWTLGFIPIMIGVGLLIYYWLIRRA